MPVTVAVCAVVTADTVAVKDVVVAPPGTVTEAGTNTALLLLLNATDSPPAGAAEASVAVQISLDAPVMDALAHESAVNAGGATPAALSLMMMLPADELLVIVTMPVNVLTCGEVNVRVNGTDCPEVKVRGSVTPDHVNNEPTIDIPETVTGAVPVELSVTVCDAVWPATTLPKFTVVVLTRSTGVTFCAAASFPPQSIRIMKITIDKRPTRTISSPGFGFATPAP